MIPYVDAGYFIKMQKADIRCIRIEFGFHNVDIESMDIPCEFNFEMFE
jgi:hypothetical protein